MSKYKMNIAEFPTQDLIKIVSDLLDSMLLTNNQIPTTQITYFHSRAVPNITVLSYLTRIHKFAPFTNEALLSILIYFDSITKLENGFTINSYNIHRLLITSLVVASKFTSDVFYANSRYAKVGGIPLRELNQLELEFLFLINFQLHIKLPELQDYADQLLSHAMSLPNPITLQQTSIISYNPTITPNNNNTTTTTTTTTINANHHHHHHYHYNTKPIVLPLTPPYPTIETKSKKNSYHPYKRPHTKNRLGLVSPKDL
ncbi:cyclin-domain-containing protein [Pilaira anomala]|nr:cyclin-domain-containing protein [Pilaira anomala]